MLVVGSFSSWAQPLPMEKPNGFVIDAADVFSSGQVSSLNSELQAFSDTTSNQIVVVTMSNLGGYEPWEVARNIGQKWGVGQGEFDNGIVILFKPKTANSRGQINIQMGYGLEGAIPDATAKMIIENEMIPYFRNGDTYGGIKNGLITLKSLAAGEITSDAYGRGGGKKGSWFPLIFIFLVLGISLLAKARSARSYSVGHNMSFWTALWLLNSSRGHGGHYNNFTSGGGGFGGGGFGGFGGGGFGGGGAGGSW